MKKAQAPGMEARLRSDGSSSSQQHPFDLRGSGTERYVQMYPLAFDDLPQPPDIYLEHAVTQILDNQSCRAACRFVTG